MQTSLPFVDKAPPPICPVVVALDIEGNGHWGEKEEIVELGVVRLIDLRELNGCKSWLVKPEESITRIGTRVHGIRNADVSDMLSIRGVADEITGFVGTSPIVAHNARTEFRLLRKTLPKLELPVVFDTLRLARAVIPGEKHYGLAVLVNRLKLLDEISINFLKHRSTNRNKSLFHEALFDAIATAILFARLVDRAREQGLNWYHLATLGNTTGKDG